MHAAGRAVLAAVAIIAAACAPQEPQIDRADVERIITTLADDDMQGRRAFTPAADAAAEFISAEFSAVGLEPFDGGDDYMQSFSVYALSVDRCAVTINGTEMAEEAVACNLSASSLDWSTGDGVHVVVVGPDANPMRFFMTARRGGVDTLMLVHPQHEETFARLQGFLGRGSRSLDLEGGASTVLVLTDAPVADSYSVQAAATAREDPLANVVGVIPGRRAEEIVLFSAHYDHIGLRQPVDGDEIANGANDDASGTTAVIELARYFSGGRQPERTLLFVAFTAEEVGGYGSSYFSRQLDPAQVVAMFNIEMIGKVSAQGPHTAWITGFERSDFGQILQQAVEGTEYSFHPDPYPAQNLFYRSDNATLARLGVPAHSISTTQIDIDPDYHEVSDEVATLDLDHLTDTIRAIARAAGPIVSGAATPTRIDPETIQ